MIVIRIDLHSARSGKVTRLGTAIINNEGTLHDGNKCDYTLRIGRKKPGNVTPTFEEILTKPVRHATIKKWPRDRKTIWQMLQVLLNEAYNG